MCCVSVVSDYMREKVPAQQWTQQSFGEYQEILRRLGDLDRALNQPHCEDPAKLAWMRDVERRLSSLEAK
jgi:hypothetical protein